MTARAIAIDGPSGAGKGTVARAVARALAYRYVDTGAMYRAVAWKALRDRVRVDDEAAVEPIASRATFNLNEGRVVIDGHDVTQEIRTPDIDVAAAAVARLPRVRKALVARQRALAEQGGVVMEGRDIGTAVLPDAAVKIYLDASPEERAARRAADPAHVLSGAALGEVAAALAARDRVDRTRDASPLVQAPDAIAVDTTGVSVDEVIDRVLALVRAGLRGAAGGPARGGAD
ncbi:MAG: (d)CMP kinase [Acidobacteria bacterium]|nr:(d)CMP kinase [Acidobacteriota bacterium]